MARKTDTRERLLEAAISAISEGGEQALRIDRIAEAVGITKPSIYHFFGDREGLVVAALAEMYRRTLLVGADLVLAAARDARTEQEFAAAVTAAQRGLSSAEAAERRGMLTKVLGASVSRPKLQEALREVHREVATYHREFIMLGRAQGVIRMPFDLRVASLFTVAVFADRHLAEIDDGIDTDEWDALVFEVFRHLFFDDIERSDR